MNGKIKSENKPSGKEKQVSGVQIFATVFLLALATKMFLLPVFLIRSAGRDGYLVLSIGAAIDLVSLFAMLAAVKLSGESDFFTVTKNAFGATAAKIIAAVIAAYLFFKLCISASETLGFYSDDVFAELDISVICPILAVFLVAVASHTLKALSRLCEIVFPLVVIGVVALVAIIAATGPDLSDVLPVMREPDKFAGALMRHGGWIGDFTPLIMFMGRTENKKRSLFGASTSGIAGLAIAVFFVAVLSAAFANTPMYADTTTNITSILQYSTGNVYGRIDLFAVIFWSVAAFLNTALFFYAIVRCIEHVIGKDAHFVTALAVAAALIVAEIFVFDDPVLFKTVFASVPFSFISLGFSLAVPLVALTACISSSRKNVKSVGGEK